MKAAARLAADKYGREQWWLLLEPADAAGPSEAGPSEPANLVTWDQFWVQHGVHWTGSQGEMEQLEEDDRVARECLEAGAAGK